MNTVTRILFEQNASDSTGLWSGTGPDQLTLRTWQQIRTTARAAAARLAAAGVGKGDSVAILAGDPADVAVLVQATWMRGAAFTMLHQPTPRTNLETWLADTRAVVAMLGARVIAVGAPFTDAILGVDLGSAVMVIGEPTTPAGDVPPVRTEDDDTAILQLTSGTTGVAKAVEISFRNVYRNHQALGAVTEFGPADLAVSWLPLYHDMGMVGMLLAPMLAQVTAVITDPLSFLRNPLSWAELITRFRGTITAAPDFAYSVLARRLRHAADGSYDLSSLRVAVDGAEAIDQRTLDEFTTQAARFGFRPEAMMPAYGMAETTLAVSFTAAADRYSLDIIDAERAEREGVIARTPATRTRTLVRLGTAVSGIELKVVDETGTTLASDRIGTILVRGDAVTRRYLGPDGYVPAVDSEGWLNTGDLGYLTATGETVITGRKKDVIIVAGRNISPTVVERAAANVPGVRPGSVAALGIRLPTMAREGIAVITESDVSGDADACERIRKAVARAVYDDLGIAPAVVTIVGKGALPKTPSGKLRRAAAASLLPG